MHSLTLPANRGRQNNAYGLMAGPVRLPAKDHDILIFSNIDTISGRHYANSVPDELFTRAAIAGGDGGSSAQRHAQQKLHEAAGSDQRMKKATDTADDLNPGLCKDLRDISISPCKI